VQKQSFTVKEKGKFALEQTMKAQVGSRDIALYSSLNLCSRWAWMVNAMSWLLNSWERDLLPIIHKARWAPVQVWTGAENLATPGFNYRTI
jgi:hypothetical protein